MPEPNIPIVSIKITSPSDNETLRGKAPLPITVAGDITVTEGELHQNTLGLEL